MHVNSIVTKVTFGSRDSKKLQYKLGIDSENSEKINKLTALLCEACFKLEQSYNLTGELYSWYQEHRKRK